MEDFPLERAIPFLLLANFYILILQFLVLHRWEKGWAIFFELASLKSKKYIDLAGFKRHVGNG